MPKPAQSVPYCRNKFSTSFPEVFVICIFQSAPANGKIYVSFMKIIRNLVGILVTNLCNLYMYSTDDVTYSKIRIMPGKTETMTTGVKSQDSQPES